MTLVKVNGLNSEIFRCCESKNEGRNEGTIANNNE